jgi:hydrogenase expression/formation protein HypC
MFKQWCISTAAVFMLWGGLRFLGNKVRQVSLSLFLCFLFFWSFVASYPWPARAWLGRLDRLSLQLPIFILIGLSSLSPALNRLPAGPTACMLRPMCLAIPGKITSISGEDALMRMGKIDYGGIQKEASLACVPEAKVGDYVIVHAGFAISRLDEEEANKVFEYLRQMGDLSELQSGGSPEATWREGPNKSAGV